MKKIIVIVGPTGSSKTKLSYMLAQLFDFEIINSDAFQVYKEINAGINKPSTTILKNVKHHLMDHLSIFDEWDIKLFKNAAEAIIDNSSAPLIICGGSNLYVDALIKNYNLSNKKRGSDSKDKSTDQIYEELYKLDPNEAFKIGKNNRKILLRAIEIIEDKNILKSEINNYNFAPKYEPFIIFLNPNRKKLYEKINLRTIQMFDEKIVDEINAIGLDQFKKTNASKAIGYKTIIENDLIINDEIINKIQQETRNYAKRQVTWIRNKFDVNFETDNFERDFDLLVSTLKTFLKEH
ncbi:MAG: tRNA (adenosine(37)-N6)-dimethylallyltransferase MiaA [Mycoplasmoidaceae bacterium]